MLYNVVPSKRMPSISHAIGKYCKTLLCCFTCAHFAGLGWWRKISATRRASAPKVSPRPSAPAPLAISCNLEIAMKTAATKLLSLWMFMSCERLWKIVKHVPIKVSSSDSSSMDLVHISPVHELVLQPGSLPAVWGPQQLLSTDLPPSAFLQGRLSCFASMQSPLIKRISSSKSLCCKEPRSISSHVGHMFNVNSTKCHFIWKTHWQGLKGNIEDSGSAKFPFLPSLGNVSPLHPSSTRCHLGLIEAYQLWPVVTKNNRTNRSTKKTVISWSLTRQSCLNSSLQSLKPKGVRKHERLCS